MNELEAERQLIKKIKAQKPKSKDEALDILALMMASGRVRKPTKGGPPPQPKSVDE